MADNEKRGGLWAAQMMLIKDPANARILLIVARNPGCTKEFIREEGGDLRVLKRVLKEGVIFEHAGLYYPAKAAR